MANNETYNLNYFFRDYVTDDLLSFCVGELYIYHYKETLIGFRISKKRSCFVDLASIKAYANHFAPTLEQLTEQHIKECYEEADHSEETTERAPINELAGMVREALGEELSRVFDNIVLSNNPE